MEQVEGCYGCRMLARRVADAQATIAALQAVIDDHHRLVREMDVRLNGEQGAAKQASLCDIASQVVALQARVKELEAIFQGGREEGFYGRWCGLLFRVNKALAEDFARVKAERDDAQRAAQGMSNDLTSMGRKYEELRILIAALPVVEGEIEVSSGVYNFILLKHDGGTRFLCGQIETEQTAKAIAALWQHRQGME